MTTQQPSRCSHRIPNHLHFVWYGQNFPLLNRIAITSALMICRPERLTLWCSAPLAGQAEFEPLRRCKNFDVRRLDAASLFPQDPSGVLNKRELRKIYDGISSPISRSNLTRAWVLYRHGGIYLDMDTLVLRDLAPLRRYAAFLGTERVVWPGERKKRVDAYRLLIGPLLSILRRLGSRIPGGERLHLRTASWYPREVNGAIMGCEAGHPFLACLLKLMTTIPEREWNIPHRLGTHLLQYAVKRYAGHDLKLLGTEYFYPLGPIASAHYFRCQRNLNAMQCRVLTEQTCAIHWYASNTALNGFTSEDLQRQAGKTLFARLCAPYVSEQAVTL